MVSKTPGGQAASDKFKKQEAQSTSFKLPTTPSHRAPTSQRANRSSIEHGEGAPNAPGHTEGKAPGEVRISSFSLSLTPLARSGILLDYIVTFLRIFIVPDLKRSTDSDRAGTGGFRLWHLSSRNRAGNQSAW